MKKIFTLLLLICVFSFQNLNAQSTTVVISQAFGGGGGSTGTYLHDYVELHNVSNSSQDISGFVVAYGSATGNWGSSISGCDTLPASTIIPAGGYYLIQYGSAGTAGVALPVTPDRVSTKLSMSATNGKVGLFNTSWVANQAGGAVSAFSVDRVAYGTGNDPEGTATPVLTSTSGAVRKTNGCTDTDNNLNDFDIVTAPTPRNSASTIVNCTTTPIKLNSFNAVGLKNSVNLSWLTYADETGGKFEIERSIDGSSFENISTINAYSLGNASYEITDRNLPAVKTLFYRLKLINADGRFEYSTIQKVQLRDVKLTVSPNPASNEILVNASENIKSVEVYDIRGRRMMVKENINLNQTRINVTTLKDGTYIVKTLIDGEVTTNQIMVKH